MCKFNFLAKKYAKGSKFFIKLNAIVNNKKVYNYICDNIYSVWKQETTTNKQSQKSFACDCPTCHWIRANGDKMFQDLKFWSYFLHFSGFLKSKMHSEANYAQHRNRSATLNYKSSMKYKTKMLMDEVKGWHAKSPGQIHGYKSINPNLNSGNSGNFKRQESQPVNFEISAESLKKDFAEIANMAEFSEIAQVLIMVNNVIIEQDLELQQSLKASLQSYLSDMMPKKILNFMKKHLKDDFLKKIKNQTFNFFELKRLRSMLLMRLKFLKRKVLSQQTLDSLETKKGSAGQDVIKSETEASNNLSPKSIINDPQIQKIIRNEINKLGEFLHFMQNPIIRCNFIHFAHKCYLQDPESNTEKLTTNLQVLHDTGYLVSGMETIYQNDIKTNLSHLQKLERVSNRELKLTNVTSELISKRLGSKCKELTIDLFKYWEEYQKSVKDNLEVPENFVKNAKANGGNSDKLKSMRKKAPKNKPTSSKKPLEIVSRKDKYTVVYIDENLPPRVTFSLAEGMKMFLPRPREELNVQFLPKTI